MEFRRLWAASDFLDGQKVTKEPLGDGSGWALCAHIRRPLGPHYGRYPLQSCKSTGAQNMSDFLRFLPAHWGLGGQK